MKTKYLLQSTLLISFMLIFNLAHSQTWKLVWSDEFHGKIGPDWVYETGTNGGWGNSELENYTTANASTDTGNLIITAKCATNNYTSVRMKTYGKKSWKYGKIEARIKLPAFNGSWPAFWMLGNNINTAGVGWPKCGEIDIMEQINTNQYTSGAVHWYSGGQADYSKTSSTISVSAYHVYSIEWDASYITWFIDGKSFMSMGISGIPAFQNNFFIILNLALGGQLTGYVTPTNGTYQMFVDYVRVWQRSNVGVDEIITNKFLNLAPNPVDGALTIKSDKNLKSIVIYNMNGSQIYNQTNPELNTEISFDGFASGLYCVQATDTDGNTQVEKIIKK